VPQEERKVKCQDLTPQTSKFNELKLLACLSKTELGVLADPVNDPDGMEDHDKKYRHLFDDSGG